MKNVICIVAVLAIGACTTRSPDVGGEERALSVAREAERLSGEHDLWPGFDPIAIPLAIYVDDQTFLFRHPAPPGGFSPVARSEPAMFIYEGRHPAVTANSSAEIGDMMTATLLLGDVPIDRSSIDLAAVALHEAFHVDQRERHPGWQANEGDLFLYPTDDARILARRRLETAALRRALAESDRSRVACWAWQALAFRRERFAAMDPAFAAYERGTELNEGLATYVQLRATGRMIVEIPIDGFAATEVRRRSYAIGPAIALLLDRFAPGWPDSLEADDQHNLDDLLEAALNKRHPDRAGGCAFTTSEIADTERIAHQDAAAVVVKRGERRKAFDTRKGWRVVIQAADGHPLWPQGFDPLNVERVEGGLLHTRFLRAGNDSGQIEAMDGDDVDIEALSEGIGPHPLFNGMDRVVIAGLAKPEIETEGGHVVIRGAGLTATFEKAVASESDTEVLVQLESTD